MKVASMHQLVDTHCPIPIRWQLTAPRNHGTEGGGAPRNPALPSIRELAGLLGTAPNTRVRAIEDLKQSGYRPLLPLTAAAPSSIPRVPPGPRRRAGDPVCCEALPSTYRAGPAG
jgi:hypothetical protein